MLTKLNLVQKLPLPASYADLGQLSINRQIGQIEKSALRFFIGSALMRQILLRFHDVKPEHLDVTLAKISWKVRLLEEPLRVSISYWTNTKGKQPRRYRILFRAELRSGQFELSPQSFRHGT